VRLDLVTDINREYADALNYPRVDRFMIKILWWHFGFTVLLAVASSYLRLSAWLPSPFAWRVLSIDEASSGAVIGLLAAAIPTLIRDRIRNHYVWRLVMSAALTTYSYVFVFLSGGSIEMHFHFFMVMALITVYSDWRLGWFVLVLTALHHVILNYTTPTWVYFYGRNDLAVVAHIIPVASTAVFTTLLCVNQRRSVATAKAALEQLAERTAALQRSETFLAEAQRLSHTGSVGWKVSSGELYWSEETFRIFGYDRATAPTLALVLQRTHPRDRAMVQHTIDRARRDGKDFDVEHRLLMPDGSVKHLYVVGRAAQDDESGHREFVGAVTDITERKQAEEALRRSETYLAEAQRLTHAGSWAWNIAPRQVVHSSQELYRVLGYDPDGGLPTFEQFLQRVHPEDRDGFVDAIERAIRERTDIDVEHRIVLPDGTVKYAHHVGHPVFNASGDLIQFVGSTLDVSDRKRAEEVRERLQADLAHVSRVTTMGELTASIAHEINQPLAAIVANANACQRFLGSPAPDLDEVRAALADIAEDGSRAGAVIARIRALLKRAPPERTPLDVNEVIGDVLGLVRAELHEHEVVVETELGAGLPPVAGDRVQLQQVLLNLILNGIEAMAGIRERTRVLRIRSRSDGQERVVVSVEDRGVGLAPREVDHIFQPFFTTKPGGMGMGLSISRSIIEAHGGRLWVTPNADTGVTVQFALPTYSRPGP
jgi:PAS domain S-box-containing protein